MGKQIMIYAYNGVLLSDKKEWIIDTCNMDDSQDNSAEWKKPDKKEHILYDSTYKKF